MSANNILKNYWLSVPGPLLTISMKQMSSGDLMASILGPSTAPVQQMSAREKIFEKFKTSQPEKIGRVSKVVADHNDLLTQSRYK